MKLETIYKKLAAKARAWGGRLVFVEKGAFRPEGLVPPGHVARLDPLALREKFYYAPFDDNLGCYWESKQIVAEVDHPNWPGVIHEMGHCFADKEIPNKSEEWDWLGWEAELARTLGLPMDEWQKWNRDYQINDLSDSLRSLGDLSPRMRDRVLARQVRDAKALGLIVRGRPVAIR